MRTPVWFVQKNSLIYVVTREKTGKVKRLRKNPQVRISLCTFNGRPESSWISGTASFANEVETKNVVELRKKKYGFMERIARIVSKSKGDLVVFSITLNNKEEY